MWTCGDCVHCCYATESWFCWHPAMDAVDTPFPQIAEPDGAPPDWCPLRERPREPEEAKDGEVIWIYRDDTMYGPCWMLAEVQVSAKYGVEFLCAGDLITAGPWLPLSAIPVVNK